MLQLKGFRVPICFTQIEMHSKEKSEGIFRKTVIWRLIWGCPPLAGFALRDYGASPCSYSDAFKSQDGIVRFRLYFSGVH